LTPVHTAKKGNTNQNDEKKTLEGHSATHQLSVLQRVASTSTSLCVRTGDIIHSTAEQKALKIYANCLIHESPCTVAGMCVSWLKKQVLSVPAAALPAVTEPQVQFQQDQRAAAYGLGPCSIFPSSPD